MKKLFLAGMISLFLFACTLTVFAANYPEHQNRMVNDFAGVLDAQTKDRIEKKLRDFEKQTTNEIAVAIVPDMQGEDVKMFAVELFKKWGIGKKKEKNGLLLLVSMKERKWRFETGYGLEGVLNDGKLGQIARENMVPYFKKGNFGKGIEEGLSVIINELAPPPPKVLSPEELKRKGEEAKAAQAAMLLEQQKEKELKEKVKSGILYAVTILAFLIFAAIIGYLLLRWIHNACAKTKMINEKKDVVQFSLQRSKESMEKFSKRMKNIEQMTNFPIWIQSKFDTLIVEAKKNFQELENELARIQMPNNVEKLDDNIEITQKIEAFLLEENRIIKELEDMPAKIIKMRQTASVEIAEFEDKIINVEKLADHMAKDGYKIDASIDKETKSGRLVLEEMKNKIKNDDAPDLIISAVKKEAAKFSAIKNNLSSLNSAKVEVEKKIISLPKTAKQLFKEKAAVSDILDKLKKNHAEKIWKNFVTKFAGIDQDLKSVGDLVSSAEEKGSMKQQKFSEAITEIRKAEQIVINIQSLLDSIRSKYAEVEEAKANYDSAFSKAEYALQKAMKEAKHADANGRRKKDVEAIREKLASTKEMVESSKIVDWIAIVAILAVIIAEASKIEKSSRDDIAQAELSRVSSRRRREEEESSYRSSSSFDSGSMGGSSGGGSDSFDFGGGDSGGGGADGSF